MAGPAAASSVDIEKSTNGQDADTGSGPTVVEGDVLTWTWRVSAGASELYDIVVTDTSGLEPNCDTNGDGVGDGTFIHPGPLEPGQSFTCTATGQATTPGQTSVGYGEVQAYDFDGSFFADRDPSHYTVVAAATTTTAPAPSSSTDDDTTASLSDDDAGSSVAGQDADSDDGAADGLTIGRDTDDTDSGLSSMTGADLDGDDDQAAIGSQTLDAVADDETDVADELAMTSDQDRTGGRSTWPIGLGLVFVGCGLLYVGYRLDTLLGLTARTASVRSADEPGLGHSDVLD
jgi:hypothetical protein